MKKKFIFTVAVIAVLACLFAISVSAAPLPQKPDIGVNFGAVEEIEGFTSPSQLYVGTAQCVLLSDGNGGYVTYPTYYVTKDSTTFDFDFSKLNSAQSVQYTKKSVVMVEIPNGVTDISNSYFAGTGNFPLCVSVQIPGSVTTYGNRMFETNTVIRVVEFLDGTDPVTMGDGMFTSNWSVGTTNLEYVKFPNNLVSIGNGTFGKSHANKTIILGANLKSIGANFFGESTPDDKDTFLYVSENLFADVDMSSNLFGGFDQYHNNLLKLTIFYTGSLEKAQAFVDKGLAVQTGYVWSNPTFVSASEYDYEQHKNTKRNSVVMVYGYERCDAFYGGHAWNGANDVIVNSYFEEIGIGDTCANCGKNAVKETIAPIFEWQGYSVNTFGDTYSVTQGYKINKASIEAYKKYAADFDFGVLAIANLEGKEISPSLDEAFLTIFNNTANDFIDIKLDGITKETKDTCIVFCVYVTVGGELYYLDNGVSSKTVVGVSYNKALELSEANG